jgi:hypothetical protein
VSAPTRFLWGDDYAMPRAKLRESVELGPRTIKISGPAAFTQPFLDELGRLGPLLESKGVTLLSIAARPYSQAEGGANVAATTEEAMDGQLITVNCEINVARYYEQASLRTDIGGYARSTHILDLARFAPAEMLNVIADHEVGHLWMNEFSDSERAAWNSAITSCSIADIAHVSSYATTDPDECFAEMFSAYVNGAGGALPETCRAWFDGRVEPIFIRQTPRNRPGGLHAL